MRICVSVAFSANTSAKEPDNEYLLVTSKPGWALLEGLIERFGSPKAAHEAFNKLLHTRLHNNEAEKKKE